MKLKKTKDPSVYLAPNGTYYYRYGGILRSLKTKDFKESLVRKRLIAVNSDRFANLKEFKMNELIKPYLESRALELETHKIRQITFNETSMILSRYLLPYFGKYKLSDIDSTLWSAFAAKKKTRDLTNQRKVLKHFLTWCLKNKQLRVVPIFDLNPIERRPRRILNAKEIETILYNSCGRLRIFISLALFMGMRRREILTLDWSRIDINNETLYITKEFTKIKRARILPLHPDCLSELKHAAGLSNRSKWVFFDEKDIKNHANLNSLNSAWNICLKDSGCIRRYTFHDLRATCEYLAHMRKDLTSTQLEKFFGSSVDVQRKIYVSMDADDLRSVVAPPQLESKNEKKNSD